MVDVMRIISGSARGTSLYAPKGLETRPTQDRIKESLFNILQGKCDDASVLDLFAGSGALAFESISRGGIRAVLVDCDREASQCIKRNIEKLKFQQQTQFIQCDWKKALKKLSEANQKFDLIFLDPPYRMEILSEICTLLEEMSLLNSEAIIVLEHKRGYVPTLNNSFELWNFRDYKDTQIHIYQYNKEDRSCLDKF